MIVEADLTWTGTSFERGVRVDVAQGLIATVGADGAPDERLEGKALLPGFVNAHSHAFQRYLRGRGETFPEGAGSFWTWREAMYELVEAVAPADFRALCLQAYREMRRAGITTVGEFHYFHHAKAGGDDYVFDELVLDAAKEAGLRIVLLNSYYHAGGIGKPLDDAQLRFRSQSPDAYWKQMDRLAGLIDPATQSLGACVHSIRAAPAEHLKEIAAEAARRGLVLHMHVEEQPAEIDECRAAYGKTPMQVILDTVDLSAVQFTAVHCTHTTPEDLRRFEEAGGLVCVCPLTEANLGDGIPDLPKPVCLGTDSNARISMLEEIRWLEYGQRLRRQERGAYGGWTGPFRAATETGALSLGIDHTADLVAIDLDAETLAGWSEDTLLAALCCGAAEEAIAPLPSAP